MADPERPEASGDVGRRIVSPALIGRGRELAVLVSAVLAPPAVVVVEGEAGIGKTRLVGELREHRELGDRSLVVGWCRMIREPFPLGPVIEAVRSTGDELVGADLSPVAGALRPLLPEIARLLPPRPEPLADRVAERHRVFRALMEVLGSLGKIVVVLEDLHWADTQTVDFLSYLLADPPSTLSLVLTFRGEEVEPAVRALTVKLPASVSRTKVVLSPLDMAQTGGLAAAILGTDQVSEDLVAYLSECTAGLPFAIEELMALLRARGSLVRGGGWSRRAVDTLDVPTRIRDSVLARVSGLSGDARSVAEAAAVLQTPVLAALLLSVCRLSGGRAAKGLTELLDSGVLIRDGNAVGFRHLLAAQAVYEDIAGLRRQRLHDRAASALTPVSPAPLGQIAHHWRLAGRFDAWVEVAERAADQAVSLGHDEEAVVLLEDVLRHARLATHQRGRLAVKLGRAAMEAACGADVLELLSGTLERDLPVAMRGELRFLVAILLHQTGGDVRAQRRLLAGAVQELDGRPDLQAWAMIGLGVPMGPGVPLAEHLRWLDRALDILPVGGDPDFDVLMLGKATMIRVAVGERSWRELVDRIVAQAGGAPRKPGELNAYFSVGLEACNSAHHAVADQLLARGLEGASAGERRRLELMFRSARTLLDYYRGSWHALETRVGSLLEELADYTRARSPVDVVAGCLTLAHGDLDDAHRRLTEVVERVAALGDFDLLPTAAAALVRLDLAGGDTEGAMTGVQRFLAAMAQKGFLASGGRSLPTLTRAMVAAGQWRDASTLVDSFGSDLHDRDAPLAPAALAHARGFLESGRERWHPAAHHFLAAADCYEPLQCPYEAAQAREHAALSLFAAADPRAEHVLRAALTIYQGLGATWDAARSVRTARQHGVSIPASHRGGRRAYGSELSPRERQVARLAATGRTNQQIADQLFVSRKTVDKHMSAALRKLGVRSRTALVYQLSSAAGMVDEDRERSP